MTEHPYPSRRLRCVLCGTDSDDSRVLAPGLARYSDGLVASIVRCRDHVACHRRCLDVGDTWPLDELVLA